MLGQKDRAAVPDRYHPALEPTNGSFNSTRPGASPRRLRRSLLCQGLIHLKAKYLVGAVGRQGVFAVVQALIHIELIEVIGT